MSKANKHDIVVLSVNHSATTAKQKNIKYNRYYVAVVTKTNRNGIVLEAQKIGSNHKYAASDAELHRIFTIEDPEKQALARTLAKLLKEEPAKNYYENQKLVIDAILSSTP